MKKLIRALRQPPRVWIMLVESLCLSAWYRWHVLHRPFSALAPKIGFFQLETAKVPQDQTTLKQVHYAVAGICKHTPWESRCLIQALTAKKILNRRGFPCTLYMGVAKNECSEMIAHAWLRCGTKLVTGGNAAYRFTVTAIFGDKENTE